MKKIFWLPSFPKSGNTWMRAILSCLFFTKDGNFDFNLLNYIINFDIPDKYKFVNSLSVDDFNKLHELTVIAKYWLEAQKRAEVGGDFAFFKTHSGNVTLNKHKYTDEKNVLGLIYVVRDPRDVVVSYAKYLDKSTEDIIQTITNRNAVAYGGFHGKKLYPFLLSSWDVHYKSWKMLGVPKLVIKYESLLNDTRNTLNQIVDFFTQNYDFGFNNIEMKIENIIETTDFKMLQKIEKQKGFVEASQFHSEKKTAECFFRKGTEKQWKKELTKAQLKTIEGSFESTMKELGYLI